MMYQQTLQKLQTVTIAFEKWLNKVFSQQYNPFYYHGALPNFFMWTLFITGILLFVYFQPTLDSAFISVNYISTKVPFGSITRGLHRYAADAMMITVILHALRVYLTDRYRKYRWLVWYTGILLLIFMFVIGITGYILVWDERSYMIVLMLASALKQIPLIGGPLALTFVNGDLVTSYTMAMAFFLHVGISFLLLYGLWWHYLRISRPVTDVPLGLGLLLFASILIPAGVIPVISGKPAVLTQTPTEFPVDWFYLWIFPMFSSMPAMVVWTILFIITAILLAVPFLITDRPKSPATVSLENCVGCTLCAKDCPYEAIYMVPRTDHPKYKQLAVVIDARCAECGLCVGACAFKAIDLPYMNSQEVIAKIGDIMKEPVGAGV
ncbi:MAG: cytochrome b N-terminal domain-containing protein [Candidatus Melainabacteria bacterium]|nr:cytochrome b N-terminal domain-containing protein [Candidatus Melainabacteria bacterium]MBI3309455.1 cytochrome b N-terminal domain-containing protein [Candidatus Melainabacteria bacterium]